jgi:hypothetical protein
MIIWKPLVKFHKQRKEWAWHTDFALEEGEALSLVIGSNVAGEMIPLDQCPKGKQLKIHMEICIEPFDKEES